MNVFLRQWPTRRALLLGLSALAVGCRRKPLPTLGAVAPFTLTDQTGQPFRSEQRLPGNIWVANFIFTHCQGPCPRMSRQMKRVQDAVARYSDVRLVSFTIDPVRDTPPVLAHYAQSQGAQSGRWYFLTGPQATLHQLNRHVFMLGDVDGSLEHSSRFTLVDGQGNIRAYYRTEEPEALPTLLADIASLRNRLWS